MVWRTILDENHAALAKALAGQFEAELTQAREAEGRQIAGALNQALRGLRQSPSESRTLQMIVDSSSPWAQRAVVLLVEDKFFRMGGNRGVPGLRDDFSVPMAEAPALAACAESRDPMTVLCTPGEMGTPLMEALGEGEGKVWMFPVVVRQRTAAVLVATGAVSPVPLEALAEAIGMRLESQRTPVLTVAPPGAALSGIVQIQTAPAFGVHRIPTAWEDLSAEDQSRHLLAQRVARVRVAEMRLADAAGLEKAVFAGTIYSVFREAIDRAREEFLRYHLSKSATMVDYLHLEILRSLAHDDELLLGGDYPGPMA